ncbi:MAG: flagellin [Tepidisphaeraceae bacterium]
MSRINSNINSLQATIALSRNNSDLATRLQRLSTGLRINSGKDDPAGLIASETLRSEINGINKAVDNTNRASNVINVAEGALNEVSSLLNEVQSLTISSANTGACRTTKSRPTSSNSTRSSTRSTASPTPPASTASSCWTARWTTPPAA